MYSLKPFNLDIHQGDDELYVVKVEVCDKDGNMHNADLEGCFVKLVVFEYRSVTEVAYMDVQNQCLALGVLDDNHNFNEDPKKPYAIKMHFPSSMTRKLSMPKYDYELYMINRDNIKETVLRGTLIVSRGLRHG